MRFLLLISFCIALISCGGEGDIPAGSVTTTEEKNLFSLWEETATGNTIDLRAGGLSATYAFYIYLDDGAQCDCELTFLGSETSGNYVLNNCEYDAGSSIDGDPGCNSNNHTGTYNQEGTSLTVCDSTQTCSVYK